MEDDLIKLLEEKEESKDLELELKPKESKLIKNVENEDKLKQEEGLSLEDIDLSEIEDLIKEVHEFRPTEQKTPIPSIIRELPKEFLKVTAAEWAPKDPSTINERYPLIAPLVYVHIWYDPVKKSLIYEVEEPRLTKREREILKFLQDMLRETLEVSMYQFKETEELKQILKKHVDEILEEYDITLTPLQYEKIMYYIERDFLGLGVIEPIMRDPNIEDVSCDGCGIPIYVYHRKYGNLISNIVFKDFEELNKYVVFLAQKTERHISMAEPLLDGALPDGSRIQITYSPRREIAMKGSTFTIRKFSKDPLTITDLLKYGTVSPFLAAYLWLAIEQKQSVLVSGGTASGKTTLLTALAMFIPPNAKIISIEDTAELRIPHENWVQKVARPGYGPPRPDGTRAGEVSMFDLLKAALRERPDYIIVGEVRGAEAAILFQGMATGHPGMATIHAEDFDALIDRLITKPIDLPPALLESLDLVLFVARIRMKGYDVRRIKFVTEIVGLDLSTHRPIPNHFMKWDAKTDSYIISSQKSHIIEKIIENRGLSEDAIWIEIQRRITVLEYLKSKNIRHYREVGRYIAMYYQDPEAVISMILDETKDVREKERIKELMSQ